MIVILARTVIGLFEMDFRGRSDILDELYGLSRPLRVTLARMVAFEMNFSADTEVTVCLELSEIRLKFLTKSETDNLE